MTRRRRIRVTTALLVGVAAFSLGAMCLAPLGYTSQSSGVTPETPALDSTAARHGARPLGCVSWTYESGG